MVECNGHAKFYLANSSGSQSQYVGEFACEEKADRFSGAGSAPKAVMERIRQVKGLDATDPGWERLQADASHVHHTGFESGQSAATPGSCAAQQAILLALEAKAIPRHLSEVYYAGKHGDGVVKNVWHWQDDPDRPTVQVMSTQNVFGARSHVPPCGTCTVVVPAVMCNVKGGM